MSNTKKQQKKKAREQKNKQQTLQRRLAKVKKDAEANKEKLALKKFKKKEKDRERLERWADEFMMKLPKELREQLEQNIASLSGMEEEYEKELDARRKRNLELETDGAGSLTEKMDRLRILSGVAEPKNIDMQEKEEHYPDPTLVADAGFRPQT